MLDEADCFLYNWEDVKLKSPNIENHTEKWLEEEVLCYEDDFSAEKQTEIESSWLSCKNEYSRRKKSISFQESKGKSQIIRLMN